MVFWRTNPHQTQSKNINRKDDKIMGATKKQLAIQKRIREMTNDDLLDILLKYKRINLVRPTGYGKTYHFGYLTIYFDDKNCLYLYPSEVVADAAKDSIIKHACITDPDVVDTIKMMSKFRNVTMMTYAMFSRLSPDEIKKLKFDVVLADESHLLGGKKIKQNFHILQKSLNQALFVGATATPMRMDGFDVTKIFFKNKTCFKYDIHDALKDGMYLRPTVIYGVYTEENNDVDIDKYIKEAAFLGGQFGNKIIVDEVVKKKYIEWCNINGLDKIFERTCKKHVTNTDTMKWIAFFASISHLKQKLPSLKESWQKAFPNHTIKVTIVHSGDKVTRSNQKKLNAIKKEPKTINIIACVNMLNVGYHVSDLNGIIMYRATKSDTIYIQQMGRCLTFGGQIKPVIFDIVDNIHRNPIFDTTDPNGNPYGRNGGKTKGGKNRKKKKRIDTGLILTSTGDIVIVTETGFEPTDYTIDDSGNIWLDDELTDFHVDPKTNKIYTTGNDYGDINININDIDPSTVTVDSEGRIATYREFIARLVMTETYQAAKTAIFGFTYKYCMVEKIKFPISNKKWQQLLALPDKQFADGFKECFTKNGIPYPYNSPHILTKWGLDKSTPAEWFAQHNHTTIGMMCDLLGIK